MKSLFYLIVFHDNQSSHIQHCDAFTAAVACDPTSRVLHQNPKRALQPVTVILLAQTEERGKTDQYEGQMRKESEKVRTLALPELVRIDKVQETRTSIHQS